MKPIALITRRANPPVVDLLASVCHILPKTGALAYPLQEIRLLASCAHALLVTTPEPIDESLLRDCPRLRVIACTFRIPENIDIAACTRRGIWVTTVAAEHEDVDAELEAARNILDALSGDTPRGAVNEILLPAS